ncbi:competence type IV pilus ATPase ComGA [Evansella halocellulosilytica]|uniref:competence type IV pilus ATPase ComGA n=1 Tax=Evansella halocellulosilytica TaxID=2011013 RepID=UPI000BB77368|nr:competence type IV pilus ATPase ComGA [Evansella halocellulosilytica]
MQIEQMAKEMMSSAVSFQASDIHLVPLEKIAITRYRIDGSLMDIQRIPIPIAVKIISHLKFISGMDVGERRRAQNRSMEVSLQGKKYSARLSTFPSSFHETLVIRLFPQDATKNLQQLSIFPKQAQQLMKILEEPSGLLLICGPTGSGKTTTLYSLLHMSVENMNRNIITLEDPVEQRHEKLLQMEINERAGITYAHGLKSLLRHDPDVIMIGEIRDKETAKMAVRAALTGHFVLSTLHSDNPFNALKRMFELGVSRLDLIDTLKGISSQRLVDLACPFCDKHCYPLCRKHRKKRRGAVFEQLFHSELIHAIQSYPHFQSPAPTHSVRQVISKGIALGFIDENEYVRLGKGGYQ